MDLHLETKFDWDMENTLKLKRNGKEKGKKTTDTACKPKPLHGQYLLRSIKADVDLNDTHQ